MANIQIRIDKKEIKKNKLDLEYHKNTQILNAVLIFLTTGLLGFIGSFVFLLEEKNKLFLGISLSVFILIVGYVIYRKTNKKLEEILEEVERI